MKSANTVANLAIVGIQEGDEIAAVKNLLVSRSSKKVEYLSVEFGAPDAVPSLLPFQEIVGIGNDYIVIQSQASIKKASDSAELIAAADNGQLLIGTTVISSAGDIIAEIIDYDIDEWSGEILRLMLDNQQEIDGGKVLTISPKIVFVDLDGNAPSIEPYTPYADIAVAAAPIAEEDVMLEEAPLSEQELEGLDENTIDYLLGMTVNSDISSEDGGFFVAAGTVLTRDIIIEAARHDALLVLTLSTDV
ncbi:PRC-barrel domain-containing protein [Eubacteriales bacterium OttesenSCG-928-M02]|nr:PRC-barrel domain-containing protein [Eubacteriales bacterium OttesenSCG-928-M02]